MMHTPDLERVADEFLCLSDATYTECEKGVSTLDRIIVSVTEALAPVTRSALLPTLYAYWERFFRVVFSDYVRCLGAAAIPAERFCEAILKFRLKGEVNETCKVFKASHTTELVSKITSDEARAQFKRLHDFFSLPLAFTDPTEWINTESNVTYRVLQKNCANLGLDIEEIKAHFAVANIHIFGKLNDFVGNRNAIAHGENIGPLSRESWEEQRTFVLQLMNALQITLYEALRNPAKVLRFCVSEINSS